MNITSYTGSLDMDTVRAAYRNRTLRPSDLAESVLARIAACDDPSIWISRVADQTVLERAHAMNHALEDDPDLLDRAPLLGIPFAVKDNIDVADMVTTAACPAFAYQAARSASVVEKLLAGGGLLIGKTNLDQFATGLVGLRSPYGAPRNPFNAEYLPGGSSSGSAVAVARGLVSFALGTDTAGSGRVPAGFNNIVGFKPTRGLFSNHGVVPACASLDCVSIFALTHADAINVANVLVGFDVEDPFARVEATTFRFSLMPPPPAFRFGVPQRHQMKFFGDDHSEQCFDRAVRELTALGGELVEVDFTPFNDTAALLYHGPWVAERWNAAGDLLRTQPASLDPQVREAIATGEHYSAVDFFKADYRRRALRRQAQAALRDVAFLFVPTVGRAYRVSEARAHPQEINRNLGYYTNFVNLLDLCAVAVPAGRLPNGVPWGVTLIGLPFSENTLCAVGDAIHRATALTLGASPFPLPPPAYVSTIEKSEHVLLAVSGAHMEGLPLNPQLVERNGYLVRQARTAPRYRLYALTTLDPPRPGMLRAESGTAIDIEIWSLPTKHFGSFVAAIPAPLGIGKVELEDGSWVCGFLCESDGVLGALDISILGGWRAYLNSVLTNKPALTG